MKHQVNFEDFALLCALIGAMLLLVRGLYLAFRLPLSRPGVCFWCGDDRLQELRTWPGGMDLWRCKGCGREMMRGGEDG